MENIITTIKKVECALYDQGNDNYIKLYLEAGRWHNTVTINSLRSGEANSLADSIMKVVGVSNWNDLVGAVVMAKYDRFSQKVTSLLSVINETTLRLPETSSNTENSSKVYPKLSEGKKNAVSKHESLKPSKPDTIIALKNVRGGNDIVRQHYYENFPNRDHDLGTVNNIEVSKASDDVEIYVFESVLKGGRIVYGFVDSRSFYPIYLSEQYR